MWGEAYERTVFAQRDAAGPGGHGKAGRVPRVRGGAGRRGQLGGGGPGPRRRGGTDPH